jgi:FMN phosphatase YigB (HAD superfamily)
VRDSLGIRALAFDLDKTLCPREQAFWRGHAWPRSEPEPISIGNVLELEALLDNLSR